MYSRVNHIVDTSTRSTPTAKDKPPAILIQEHVRAPPTLFANLNDLFAASSNAGARQRTISN